MQRDKSRDEIGAPNLSEGGDQALLAGRYELQTLAGKGGMATVWRALMHGSHGFRKPVAIKLMHTNLAKDHEFIRMFIEEARVCSRLTHPNIAQILDFGVDQRGKYYLTLEWVDGLDLLSYAGVYETLAIPTPWSVVVLIMIDVLKGVAAAHEHLGDDGRSVPIFHRDVTPYNVLLGVGGEVKLTDFGLARAADRGSFTLPHMIKGKLTYIAPEMTMGAPASVSSDIFAAGITLYETLLSKKLFGGETPADTLRQIQAFQVDATSFRRTDLPPALVAVIRRALAERPENRFASAREMANALVRLLPRLPEIDVLGKSVRAARDFLRAGSPLDHAALLDVSLALSTQPSRAVTERQSPIGATLRSEQDLEARKELNVTPVIAVKKKGRAQSDRRPPPNIEVRHAPPAPVQGSQNNRTVPVMASPRARSEIGLLGPRAPSVSIDIDITELTESQTVALAPELASDPAHQQPPTAPRQPKHRS